MDENNIKRWVSQVKKPDGSPMTRADAKIEKIDLGSVQVILVDLEGSVSVGMGRGGTAASGQRMINAIVNHANGPHFVKAIGPSAAMAKIRRCHQSLHQERQTGDVAQPLPGVADGILDRFLAVGGNLHREVNGSRVDLVVPVRGLGDLPIGPAVEVFLDDHLDGFVLVIA